MKTKGIILVALGVVSFLFSFADAGLVLCLMGVAVCTDKDRREV